MEFRNRCIYYVLIFVLISYSIKAEDNISPSGLKVLRRLYHQCENSDNFIKCLKIQALKFTDRAVNTDTINLVDGISIVRENNKNNNSVETDRAFSENIIPLGAESQLKHLHTNQIDSLLADRVQRFIQTHKVEFSLPKLLTGGADDSSSASVGKGRHDKMKKYIGPLIAAITLKGGLLAMTFKAVALLAGKALLVGKIALVLSAILGLRKLLSHEGHEKTTYEIVKHPHVTHSNSYSSSHYGGGPEYEAPGVGHYHRRSFDASQDKAYRSYSPEKFQ